MNGVSPSALAFFGLVLVLGSTLGSWVYLRFRLKPADPLPRPRRWTAPTNVAVGLLELSAGILAFFAGDERFWLPVVLGLILTVGGGYYLGRRTFS